MTTIYVAGASLEVDGVAGYMRRLEAAGLTVAYDWVAPVLDAREAGIADRDLPEATRARLAQEEIAAIERATFFWLLVPREIAKGPWVELGLAIALRKLVVVSGDVGATHFLTVAHYAFTTHELAARWFEDPRRCA